MGVVVIALFSNNVQGLEGSILLGISHGFVSPALFVCVGGIIYTRFHTRIIAYLKGLANKTPLFSLLFFVFILFNTAIPLSLNYLGEFLSLTGVFLQSPFIAVLGATGIVLSAAYSIWTFTRISYGSYSNYLLIQDINTEGKTIAPEVSQARKTLLEYKNVNDINRREFYILLTLFI